LDAAHTRIDPRSCGSFARRTVRFASTERPLFRAEGPGFTPMRGASTKPEPDGVSRARSERETWRTACGTTWRSWSTTS